MIQKKTVKGDLEKRRNTFFVIGLVLVLGLVYVSFELFATQDTAAAFALPEEEFIEVMDEDVIATDAPPPPETPQQQQQQQEFILNVVEDNIAVTNDWDFSNEFDENFVIEEYVPIEIVEEETELPPPVAFAEKMPEYPGGQAEMYKFLQDNIQYPESARTNQIQGVVLVEFVVERDGKVSNVEVKASLYPDCDKEAVRVIKLMKNWEPARSMGKPVRCFFRIPVTFTLT